MSRRGLRAAACSAVLACASATVAEAPRSAILFVGDGMGVATVTAARILEGQRLGGPGEEHYLSFERFENVALVKTYNTDAQVADSAGTMSAIVTGVKTRAGVLSVGPELERGDCAGTAAAALPTLAEEAEAAGMLTGIVTTTTVTHATPAALYAHASERSWESDADLPEGHDGACRDIARQFVEFPHGDGIDIVLGGGRGAFLPVDVADPEYPSRTGERRDGRHLIDEWLAGGAGRQYVWNEELLRAVSEEGQLLGLFSRSNMAWETDREEDTAGEPSLAEMTRVAIERLSRGPKGFFLTVEGGRIDHAHHAGNAYRALEDTIALAAAVRTAVELTDPSSTLILVTADHAHTLSISGYSERGNPILGYATVAGEPLTDARQRPYTTLSYANGPGFRAVELEDEDPLAPDYRQAATLPLASETHGGQDVAAYATGPGAELLRGVMDQDALHRVLREALPPVRKSVRKSVHESVRKSVRNR